jgi:hypothetical protein
LGFRVASFSISMKASRAPGLGGPAVTLFWLSGTRTPEVVVSVGRHRRFLLFDDGDHIGCGVT